MVADGELKVKKDWEIKKLEDVCEFLDSRRKPITANKRTKGPIPYYGATGILDYVADFLFDEELILLGEDGAKWGPGDKSAFRISGKTWVNNHAHVLKPKNMNYDWIIYYLNYSDLMKFVKGATVPKLNQENAKNISIPVPPLEEQKRIVKILDEKFAQLETIKAASQTNLQNAKDLFQSQLAKAFSNTTWEKKRLGDFSEITDGDHLPPPKSPRGFPFITISNIDKDSHTINFTDTFYVPETYFANLKENRKPKKGDVLYTVTGSYGIPVIVDGSVEFCFQRHIGLIRPSSEINSNYLYYWILSPEAKKIADDVATGTAQKTVSLSSLRNFEVPLPPLPEQKRIVKELDALSEKLRQLQEIYTKQIANCDELKQAYLQKAFEGEL